MTIDPTAVVQRATLALVAVLVALAASSCSVRSDPGVGSTRVLGTRANVVVTTDGGRTLVTARSVPIERSDTALSVLEAVADVRRAPDGTIAQVNGLGGGSEQVFGPDPSAWLYRVDGIESNVRPDRFRLRPGQAIWWDLRRVDLYQRLPVAIGLFPEPLFSGWRDSRRELRIAHGDEFREDAEFFRDSVFEAIDPTIVSLTGDRGVLGIGGEEGAGQEDGPETTVAVRRDAANLVIGRWEELRIDPFVADIGFDPRSYGLTVWIEGTEVRRQDPDQEFSERLAEAEGVVWASTHDAEPDGTIVFAVTGTTDEGVRAAARALRSGACQFHIACAVTREGDVIR